MDTEFKKEIILDNYQNPFHKKNSFNDESYIKINTNNESCIDNLDIYFKLDNNKIIDVIFTGEACAISTSATSILLRKLMGKDIEYAKLVLESFRNMINEKEYDKDLLGELNVYDEIYLQPNRKNCALLPGKAIDRLIEDLENDN